MLTEIWIDEKGWQKKRIVAKKICVRKTGGKKSKKEKTMAGMVMSIIKKLIDNNERIRSVKEELMEGKVKKRKREVENSGSVRE